MKRLIVLLLALITLAATAYLLGADPKPELSPTPPIIDIPPGAQTRKAKVTALSAPRPEYPPEARKHHWVGVGWFAMHVDEPTGVVASVEMLQSTGHEILDRACLDALKRWRFVPHSGLKIVKTPITFTKPATKKT